MDLSDTFLKVDGPPVHFTLKGNITRNNKLMVPMHNKEWSSYMYNV
jgi:hypothetical protein